MKKGDRGWLVIGVLLLAALLGTGAQAGDGTLRVLTVGNSFSRNALNGLSGLVKASSNRVVTTNAYIGGCDFERHMRHADAFEANPTNPAGRPYPGKRSLHELLTQEKWDIVTIQQASPKSFKPETFHPHADRLIDYIRKYAPQAEIVIHQTWAYRDDHKFWGMTNFNADVMYKGVRSAYDGFARETGFRLIPCGDAMEMARRDPAWGKFVPDSAFDPKAAVYPALPVNEKRALHNGYSWSKSPTSGKTTLGFDGIHANVAGEYLLGCVWYEFLLGQSVVGNPCVPKGVAKEDAAILQRIAHRVVTERQRPEVSDRSPGTSVSQAPAAASGK